MWLFRSRHRYVGLGNDLHGYSHDDLGVGHYVFNSRYPPLAGGRKVLTPDVAREVETGLVEMSLDTGTGKEVDCSENLKEVRI